MIKKRIFNFPDGAERHYIGKYIGKNTMHIGQHNILTRILLYTDGTEENI